MYGGYLPNLITWLLAARLVLGSGTRHSTDSLLSQSTGPLVMESLTCTSTRVFHDYHSGRLLCMLM